MENNLNENQNNYVESEKIIKGTKILIVILSIIVLLLCAFFVCFISLFCVY